ncbi:MAG: hypothetical protein V2I31_15535, partial [Mariniphaga sp.]|nr:hypothetical protein [Mariniphaga sp.]
MRLFWLILPFFIFLNNFYVLAQDWPDWRGINRDGIWPDNNKIEKFKNNQPQPEWKVTVGSGYSGPTVAKGKVYLT